MCADGALMVALDALEREAKRARMGDIAVSERDALKRSIHEVERGALFDEYKAKDKERDVSERDALLKERDAHIADMRKAQDLMASQLRELEELRKLRPMLERQVFDATQRADQLEQRLAGLTTDLTAHFAARLGAAREGALRELEGCAKRLLALVPLFDNNGGGGGEVVAARLGEAHETIDAMRLVVAKQLI